jgi:hypothetical protein
VTDRATKKPDPAIYIPSIVFGAAESGNNCLAEPLSHLLVGVKEEDPTPMDVRMTQGPVALTCPMVEGAMEDNGTRSDRDPLGPIAAPSVNHIC